MGENIILHDVSTLQRLTCSGDSFTSFCLPSISCSSGGIPIAQMSVCSNAPPEDSRTYSLLNKPQTSKKRGAKRFGHNCFLRYDAMIPINPVHYEEFGRSLTAKKLHWDSTRSYSLEFSQCAPGTPYSLLLFSIRYN